MQPPAIGQFEVLRELGRGGMGVVFLARDTRLDRLVAIKSLPEHLACDPDRLARFGREAKVLASLNHPGIGAIYGVEEVARQQYLVLEYVEGQTLAKRLENGAVGSEEEALAIARQVAEALEAAHEKGIIHRDLKPGNVMVTPDGVVKVLDFGIARTAPDPAPSADLSPDAPTGNFPARNGSPTLPGAIVGSPGYMSPEQALGKPVNKRSDIFAFGCVLFEMLAGTPAFPGENQTALMGAVLHLEPDWSRLAASTPGRIRELLRSLLSKDPRQRLHDIGDARLAIERSLHAREWERSASEPGRRLARHPIARPLPWALAAASIAIAGAAVWRHRDAASERDSASRGVVRLRADDAEAPLVGLADTVGVTISADGKQIAYQTTSGQGTAIAVRRTDDFSLRRVPSSATDMFFSPDGSLILSGNLSGFEYGSILVCPAGGGEAVPLYVGSRYVASKGCAWSPLGIIFCPAPNTGLRIISEKGGEPRALSTPDPARNEVSHRWPDVLPDGRRALITIKKSDILTFDDAEIAILDFEAGTWKTIIRGGSFARYVPTGHIVFARNGSIMAVPFDAASGEVTGTPEAVVTGVMMSPGSGAAMFAIARDSGTLVYVPGGNDEVPIELVWIDLTGKIEPVGAPVMPYSRAILSPDGGRIATCVYGASDSIFVYDLARRTNTRITFRGNCSDAAWMPDGAQIAYGSDAEGPTATYLASADGSGTPEKVADRSAQYWCLAMVDSKPVAVFEEGGDILLQPFRSESCQKIVGTQFDETSPHISPDGRWLSYASNETGQVAVYVRPFPSGEGRWQVSVGGGRTHCWARDGSAILCLNEETRQVFRVPFRASPRVEVGSPKLMFTLPRDVGLEIEPDPAGDRFLSTRNLPPRFSAEQVCVVLNWFEELKAKVPVGPR